jgi:hypothetical protein
VPSKSHGTASAPATTYAGSPFAVVVGAVLRPEQRRLRPTELAPHLDTVDLLTRPRDLPEERVRGEEDHPAAEIAEALYDVVDVRGLVLGVPRKRDEVVEAAQLVTGREPFEVVVREVVRSLPGEAQPA